MGVHYGKKYVRKWLDSYDKEKKLFVLKIQSHTISFEIQKPEKCLKRRLKDNSR